MINKVTVFEFVTEFNNFYNDVLALVEEAYGNEYINRSYTDNVYDKVTEVKNEIERTLEARVLSVEKSANMLFNVVNRFAEIAENCFENYELINNKESFEAYKFINSVVDRYNEMCEELN
jgi:hypothetical protein